MNSNITKSEWRVNYVNSDDLLVFLAVVEEGSITRAAMRLGYVPSNVTARIRQLETELHTTLFVRHSRGMTLAPPGHMLRPYAAKMRHVLNEAVLALEDSATPQGALVVGALETTAAVRLPKLLAAYHRQYPQVDLTLVTGPTYQLVEDVLQYKLEGAFVSGPVTHPDLHQEAVFHEHLVLIAEPHTGDLQSLQSKPLLVFRAGCSYRAKLEQWWASDGILRPKIMEFGTLEAILGGVSAGLGVSLLPQSVVHQWETEDMLRSYPVPQPYQTTETVFIRHQNAFITSAFRRFMEEIQHFTSNLNIG